MEKIVIAGCKGQLGQAMINELSIKQRYMVLSFDSTALNITDQMQVDRVISEVRPYAVINCAAYTKVNNSQKNIDLAYQVNALGTRNLAVSCRKNLPVNIEKIESDA